MFVKFTQDLLFRSLLMVDKEGKMCSNR